MSFHFFLRRPNPPLSMRGSNGCFLATLCPSAIPHQLKHISKAAYGINARIERLPIESFTGFLNRLSQGTLHISVRNSSKTVLLRAPQERNGRIG